MNIKKIKYHNYLRFIDEEISFDNDGLTEIIAPNGSGKSSIVKSIIFALFGKSEQNIKDLINREKNDDASIELWFDNYKVVRKIKRQGKTTAYLYNEKEEQLAEGNEVAKYIEKNILHLNAYDFQQIIIILQEEIETFLQGTNKAIFFQNTFRLNRFKKYLDIARDKRKEIEGIIEELKTENKNIEKIDGDLKTENEKLSKMIEDKNNIQKEIYLLNSKINEINSNLNLISNKNQCPVCLQEIKNPNELINHYNNENEEIRKKIEELKSRINDNEIIKQQEFVEKLKEQEFLNKNNENNKEKIEKYISEYNKYKKLEEFYKVAPKLLINHLLPSINEETKEILFKITNGFISDFKMNEDYNILVKVGSKEETIEFFSLSEKIRIALALKLAIIKLLPNINMLFLDEINLGSLDEENLEKMKELIIELTKLFKKVVLITHIESLKELPSEKIFIKKTGFYTSEINE